PEKFVGGFYPWIRAKARNARSSALRPHSRAERNRLFVNGGESPVMMGAAEERSLFVLDNRICYPLSLIGSRSLGGGGQRGGLSRCGDLPQGAGPEPWYCQTDRSVHFCGSWAIDPAGGFPGRISVYTGCGWIRWWAQYREAIDWSSDGSPRS